MLCKYNREFCCHTAILAFIRKNIHMLTYKIGNIDKIMPFLLNIYYQPQNLNLSSNLDI